MQISFTQFEADGDLNAVSRIELYAPEHSIFSDVVGYLSKEMAYREKGGFGPVNYIVEVWDEYGDNLIREHFPVKGRFSPQPYLPKDMINRKGHSTARKALSAAKKFARKEVKRMYRMFEGEL
jgi:hypothetical protein